MNRKTIVGIITVGLTLVSGCSSPRGQADAPAVSKQSTDRENAATLRESSTLATDWRVMLQQPPHDASETEKWKWWREMSRRDPLFEYKMPIRFYGRVVDEIGEPVAGATVNLTWTDASQEGTSARTLLSDARGFFSIEGVHGKDLVVRVAKPGYQHSYIRNNFSFEYASFSDAKYHEPDAARPVPFIVRKNKEAEPLVVHVNQEMELGPGESKFFPIGPKTGVQVERLDKATGGPRGWIARISVPGGGLALATEEFPFEAPETGYVPSIDVTEKTKKPAIWQGDNGTGFFVRTSQGYGRITVRNTPGMAWVYVTSYFNPQAGSRNLEFDPSKVIAPK